MNAPAVCLLNFKGKNNMSMWYEVRNSSFKLSEVPVGNATDKSIMRLDYGSKPSRQAIVSDFARCFPSRQEAVAYRLQQATFRHQRLIREIEELDTVIKECMTDQTK